MDNVTIRNKLPRSKSDLDLSMTTQDVLNSTILDSTMLSTYSKIQNNTSFNSNEYLQEIENLKTKLEQAEHEIENLNSENHNLKITIEKQEKQIDILKILTYETGKRTKTTLTPLRQKIMHIRQHTTKTSPLNLYKSVLFNTPQKHVTKKHMDEKTCVANPSIEQNCRYA
ncbi:unnamed protein product [Diatraea saccharalis]|uniref:Uncharacterized protein n=1 Tax=Diatraea saccharalis TaxID=40085 RepID=A0A9P1F9G4_9NEOP|nr:unnamed protein product [Diatraea saccharalis]